MPVGKCKMWLMLQICGVSFNAHLRKTLALYPSRDNLDLGNPCLQLAAMGLSKQKRPNTENATCQREESFHVGCGSTSRSRSWGRSCSRAGGSNHVCDSGCGCSGSDHKRWCCSSSNYTSAGYRQREPMGSPPVLIPIGILRANDLKLALTLPCRIVLPRCHW